MVPSGDIRALTETAGGEKGSARAKGSSRCGRSRERTGSQGIAF